MDCRDCELCKTRKNIVWGSGPADTGLMLIGEGPGKEEDETGRPFAGKAGRELDGSYLLHFTRILRAEWYVTNLVKCRPPNNRDPKPGEVDICSRHLQKELDEIRPRVIGALGRYATRYLLGYDVEMEMVHGIPQRGMNNTIIVPCYHPAAGMHDPTKMVHCQRDFEMLGKVVRGEVVPEQFGDDVSSPEYVTSGPLGTTNWWPGVTIRPSTFIDVLAVDTETDSRNKLYSVQFSDRPGHASFFRVDQLDQIRTVSVVSSALLLMHNALFDLPLLRSHFSAIQSKVMDTMVMAYVLQDEPQGLKALAYRHCGMKMQSYEDLVRPGQQEKAVAYLTRIRQNTWPKPEQVLVWKDDNPRLKKPWPIERKAQSIYTAYTRDQTVDMYERWNDIPLEEGRGMAEERCGPMPRAGIESVRVKDAVYYACRDADATMRIFPKLWSRIKEYDLEPAFWIDMGIVDMVLDMMAYGMPTQPEKFRQLADVFGKHADEIERDITQVVGRYINPGSSQQVSHLLFKTLGIRSKKKSKKTGEDSTDQKYLEQMKNEHPVVEKILSWRRYRKLKSTYAEALPKMVDAGGRIHPRIKTTRTSTGRLATSDPNLQNIPIRTAEGRMIRECFVAPDGCTFLGLDYSQIELRVLAHESKDKIMLEAYRQDEDIHSKTASLVFGIPVDQLHPYNHRRPAKTCNFAIVYGITPEGLHDSLAREGADQSTWTLDRCKEFINEWFKIYPGVKAYMARQELHARRHGYVCDMFGRIRRIPGIYSSIESVVSGAIRESGNMPIQAGAQEIMKIAMADLTPVYRRWQAEGKYVKPIMQIHDELLWEVEDSMVKEVYTVSKIMMENAVRLSVPVKVDGKVGSVWGKMMEVA